MRVLVAAGDSSASPRARYPGKSLVAFVGAGAGQGSAQGHALVAFVARGSGRDRPGAGSRSRPSLGDDTVKEGRSRRGLGFSGGAAN